MIPANINALELGGFQALGGTITQVGGYVIHTFNSSGTFQVLSGSKNVEILVVASGGNGYPGALLDSNHSPSGAGAGGVEYQASRLVTAGSYTVVVGNTGSTPGADGQNSSFGPITANGGGGARNTNGPSRTGGSGGGGSSVDSFTAYGGGAATETSNNGATGFGNAGGAGAAVNNVGAWGGGGGGAGSAGGNAASGVHGVGGTGYTSSISGTSVTYAKGGDAATTTTPTTPGSGAHGTTLAPTGIVIVRYLA